jgi:hypothetical protein
VGSVRRAQISAARPGAINYAVDRGRVAELFGTHETHEPTCQMLPPGFPGYVPACRYTVEGPLVEQLWVR